VLVGRPSLMKQIPTSETILQGHRVKSQSQKMRKRRRSAGVLLSGLGRIAAELLRKPEVLPSVPIHCEKKSKAEDPEDRSPVAKRLRLSPSSQFPGDEGSNDEKAW
jgi:hypothetical protein